jgi:hypothetical protein
LYTKETIDPCLTLFAIDQAALYIRVYGRLGILQPIESTKYNYVLFSLPFIVRLRHVLTALGFGSIFTVLR